MVFENVNTMLEDYYPIIFILVILFIPTGIYYLIDARGYEVPFFISAIAITNWVKAVFGVGIGIGVGFLMNRQFGEGK